jgi:hypothetical protein
MKMVKFIQEVFPADTTTMQYDAEVHVCSPERRTEAQQRALQSLFDLADTEGDKSAGAIAKQFLGASGRRREEQRFGHRHVMISDPRVLIHGTRWKQKPAITGNGIRLGKLPGDDHVSMRQDPKTGEYVRISQPYSLGMPECKDLITVCEQNGLTFVIHGCSTHYPNWCIQIEMRKDPG